MSSASVATGSISSADVMDLSAVARDSTSPSSSVTSQETLSSSAPAISPVVDGNCAEENDMKTPEIMELSVDVSVQRAEDSLEISQCRLCKVSISPAEKHKSLICSECKWIAHAQCLQYPLALVRRAMRRGWQCNDCKSCAICNQAGDAAELLLCDGCDCGIHMSCLDPPLTEKPDGEWMCSEECKSDQKPNQLSAPNKLSSSGSSGQLRIMIKKKRGRHCVSKLSSSATPDVSTWSVRELCKHMKNTEGLREAADSLKAKAIDGARLLTLTRDEVLSSLGMRMGPALKLYKRVFLLQTLHRHHKIRLYN